MQTQINTLGWYLIIQWSSKLSIICVYYYLYDNLNENKTFKIFIKCPCTSHTTYMGLQNSSEQYPSTASMNYLEECSFLSFLEGIETCCVVDSPRLPLGLMTHWKDSWNSEKAVVLKVTIYYNKRIQSSQGKKHMWQHLRKTRYKLLSVPSQWNFTVAHLILPAVVCDNTCEASSLTWVKTYWVLVSTLRDHTVTAWLTLATQTPAPMATPLLPPSASSPPAKTGIHQTSHC